MPSGRREVEKDASSLAFCQFKWLAYDANVYFEELEKFHKRWEEEKDTKRVRDMIEHFEKLQSIIFVTNNKLGRELPASLKPDQGTFNLLQKQFLLDEDENEKELEKEFFAETKSSRKDDTNAEEGKASRIQAFRRMKALKHAIRAAKKSEPFTEDFLKKVHEIAMEDLTIEDKSGSRSVTPGEYRTESVFADDYVFPKHEDIPGTMKSICETYNERASQGNRSIDDKLDLASWLFCELIGLHPFLDGNGRICRLMVCFSLIRDGLPFPVVLSSGHRRSYKHYIDAIKRSQAKARFLDQKRHVAIKTLAMVSLHSAWANFFNILDKPCIS